MKLGDVDFLHQPRQPVLGWMLLATGAAALCAAAWLEQHWAERHAQALRVTAQRQALLAAQLKPKAPTRPTLTQLRWQQAQAELQRPWLPALGSVERATKDPVYLLALAIDPSTGLVKLDAEAGSFDDALDYVRALNQGQVLQGAMLTSHLQSTSVAAGALRPTLKFSVTAHWSAP